MKSSLENYYKFVKIDEGYRDKSGLFDALEIFFLDFCETKAGFEESVKYMYMNAVKTHVLRCYSKSGEVISDLIFSSGYFNDVHVSRFDYVDHDLSPSSSIIIIEDGNVDIIYDTLEKWFVEIKPLLERIKNK